MEDAIIKSLFNLHEEQAKKLIKYFNDKFTTFPKLDGRQYTQIITYLNAFYKKEHSDEELQNIVTDGDGDAGLADAFVFTSDSVDIFDFKENNKLGLRDIQKLNTQLQRLIINKPSSFDDDDIRRIRKQLIKFHNPRNTRSKINIYIVRNRLPQVNKSVMNEIGVIKNNPGVDVNFITNKEIVGFLLKNDFLKTWRVERGSIDVLKSIKNDYLVATIPLKNLILLYDLHLKLKKDLFAQNIRETQKRKSFINGISNTIKRYPERFFLFHNGITITTSSITEDARNFFIDEPQVVNGAQTLGNLFDKYKFNLNNEELATSKILCKIIKGDQQIIDFVCETSNTQRAVKVEDLRTNDYFQKELGLFISCESGGKYEYVRKDRKDKKSATAIKYTKFFQWAYSALIHKPAEAKNAKHRLFENDNSGEYEGIKKSISNNTRFIKLLCDIGISVENYIKEERDKKNKGFLRNCDLHLVAGLFSLKSIDEKKIEKMSSLLKVYSDKRIQSDGSLNYNKIFTKSDEAWKYLEGQLPKI